MDRRVSVTVDADLSPFHRALRSGVADAKSFTKELESADSRMANLVQTGLALAPALVPLGAAAVPMLAGITAQLGFTVAAAGTLVAAFQGVGDALSALDKYKIKPTSENYAKLREEMEKLGPAGQEFVFFLQGLRPQLQGIQDIAQDGLFPGMQEGIEESLQLLPEVERIVGHISSTMGTLFAEAGDNLNDDRWVEFFEYLDREAAPTLSSMTRSLGNFFEGFTNMVMDFDPLADMFTDGLLDTSRAFVEWTRGLDESESFEDFVDYVRTNGPEAMETLGALGGALLELVEAAAPVGAVALPILQVIADTFAAIADSPIGPVLVGTAAAVGTLGRSLALLEAVGLRGENKNIFSRIFDPSKVTAGAQSLDVTTRATDRARMSVAKFEEAERKRAATFRAGVGQMGRWAAGAGALAVATTGVADSIGLANTATFGLTGAMIGGVPGAVAGGLIGLTMDLAGSNDELSDAYRRLSDEIHGLDIGTSTQELVTGLDAADSALDTYTAEMEEYGERGGNALWQILNPLQSLKGFKNQIEGIFGDSDVEELEQQSTKAALALRDVQMSLAIVAGAGRDRIDTESFGKQWVIDIDELDRALLRAKPALDALGYSAEDLADLDPAGLRRVRDEVQAWIANADSADGRTRRLAEAFAGLEDDMESTVTAAEALKGALDAVLGPGLNLSAATDAWRAGLRNLNDELAKHGRSLTAQTDAADKNRAAIRDRVGRLKDVLVAEAEAGASSGELSKMLRKQRQDLLDAGEAAGLSREELRDYLNQLGLTPKMVRTIIQLNTESAMQSLRTARQQLEALDGKTYTAIINLHTVRTGAGGQGLGYDGAADGATVPKTGKPYADRHLYLLADGEEVVSDRWGGATKNRNELKAASRGAKLQVVAGLADGGTANGGGGGKYDPYGIPGAPEIGTAAQAASASLRDLSSMSREQLRSLRKELVAREQLRDKELARERERLDMLKQEKQAFASAVASLHVSEVFGQTTQGFQLSGATLPENFAELSPEEQQAAVATQAAMLQFQFNTNQQLATQQEQATLSGDIQNIDDALALLEVLRSKGLDGPAFRELAAKGDVATLRRYAAMTRKDLKRYERQFERRAELAGDLGRYAGQAEFGAAIRDQAAAVRHSNELHRQSVRELKLVNRQIERLNKRADRLAKDTGREVGKAVNGATRAGRKGRAA